MSMTQKEHEPWFSAPEHVQQEARAILRLTIPTERGRQFPSGEEFDMCLDFLARLSGEDEWRFLIRGAANSQKEPSEAHLL